MTDSFKQKFKDGTLVPREYYCNLNIETEKDKQRSIDQFQADCPVYVPKSQWGRLGYLYGMKFPSDTLIIDSSLKSLIGHTTDCAFVRRAIIISHNLLVNSYVLMGSDRMGTETKEIPDIAECSCGKPGDKEGRKIQKTEETPAQPRKSFLSCLLNLIFGKE